MPSHRAARNEETSNPRLSVGGRSSPGCGVSLKSSNERKSQTRNSRNYLLGERGSIRLVTTVKVLFPLCTTVEVKAIIGPREDGLEPRQKRLPRRVCNRVAGSVLLALPLPLSLSLSFSLSVESIRNSRRNRRAGISVFQLAATPFQSIVKAAGRR